MLNLIRNSSVKLFRIVFFIGVLAASIFVKFQEEVNRNILYVAILVCAGCIGVIFFAKIINFLIRKTMNNKINSKNWQLMSDIEFSNIENKSKIIFSIQHLGIYVAAFGFGWMLLSMIVVVCKDF